MKATRTTFEEDVATLSTIARIYDVGNQFLRQSGELIDRAGLPRTYEEYVRRLYGTRPPDRFYLLGWGLLAAIVVAIFAVALLVAR